MPRSPSRTVVAAVNHPSLDDDDDDICPVCDGDCTCNNRFPPLSSTSFGNAYSATIPSISTTSSGHVPAVKPLKIKLTVPPSIQNKARSLGSAPKMSRVEGSSLVSTGAAGSSPASYRLTSASSTAGHRQHNLSDAVVQKRKGRLPKAITYTRDGTTNTQICGNEVITLPQSQSRLSSHTPQRSIASRTTRPQVTSLKPNLAASRQTSKSQAKGTIAKRSASAKKKRDFLSDLADSDTQQSFPTFVSANGLTSEASDSSASDSESDSDTSGFGSDSSLAAEEENYIVAEQRRHDKARTRRELLGDDAPKNRDPNNNWVIRPRKKSVGLSDVDMDDASDDLTEEDEEEDEEMEEDAEDDETDGRVSRVYTGLATGWSDDEESSFDADLFFANLTDSSSDEGSSETDGEHACDSANDSTTDPLADSVTSLRSVDFEVTEAWDGQVVFTNGSNNGRGVLDLAFEAYAAQLLASDSTSVTHDSDVEMRTSDGAEVDFDDGDSELGSSDGNTTEEELVDEQGLPTSRAMRLFQWPTSVSSINPMSTVSPNVSPAPFSRRHPPSTVLESPRPADILAGNPFWENAESSRADSRESSIGESPRPMVRIGKPIMGEFNFGGDVPRKRAVLTGVNKDVPSPYPRQGYRQRRFSSSAGSFSSVCLMLGPSFLLVSPKIQVDLRGRTAKLSIYSSLPPPSDDLSSKTPSGVALGEPIKLDDVLHSTLLDSEPEHQMQTIADSEGEQKLDQSLSRWDRVPVSAFRLTRESAASTSDVPTSPDWTPEPCEIFCFRSLFIWERVKEQSPPYYALA
ncbi:hypothetical protein JVU11DRAFT_6320 [Chiua virens]|nr:hypothetical protein JVU11DRAFT_6320 [Chiua virens]